MRTLIAVCVIALFAVTSAAADTAPTNKTPATAETLSQQQLTEAQQALSQAQQELAQTLSAANTDGDIALTENAQAKAELEQALTSAQANDSLAAVDLNKLLTEAQAACTLGSQNMVVIQPQLEQLRATLDELSRSGDLSAAGKDKLSALLDKFGALKQAQVFKWEGPKDDQAFKWESSKDGQLFMVPGQPGVKTFEFKSLPEGGFFSTNELDSMNVQQLVDRLKALQTDTQVLDGKLEKLLELEKSGKLDDLKQKLSTAGVPGAQVYTLDSEQKAQLMKELQTQDGAATVLGGDAAEGKVISLSGDRGGRLLVLRFEDGGDAIVSGVGFTESALDAVREQVKGVTGTLKITIPGVLGEIVLPRPTSGKGVFTYILPGGDSKPAPATEVNQ